MSNEEIRLAMAQVLEPQYEWEIFEDIYLNAPQRYRNDVGFRYPAHSGWIIAKNYPEDLNAMHEAEKTLEHPEAYASRLGPILLRDKAVSNMDGTTAWHFAFSHATACQRAEAFLKTKGLWKE